MSLRLVGIQGAKVGQAVALSAVEVSFGREASNTLSFDGDGQVSRRHARIVPSGGGYVVEDLGSTNGTLVNGVRIAGPTPLNAGDTVQVGSHVFRVEATIPAAPKRVEVSSSERRARGKKGAERSGIEPLYSGKPSGPLDDLDGCALPSFDLSGCWKILLWLLIILIVCLIIGGIFMLISSVAGGLGGAATPVGGSQPAHSQPQAPQSAPQGGQQQDQQQDQQQGGKAQPGIQIIQVRLDYAKRESSAIQPIVLIKWRNATENPVGRLVGRVQVFDKDGNVIKDLKTQTIYFGQPVDVGETHEDTVREGGIPLSGHLDGIPARATVLVERIE